MMNLKTVRTLAELTSIWLLLSISRSPRANYGGVDPLQRPVGGNGRPALGIEVARLLEGSNRSQTIQTLPIFSVLNVSSRWLRRWKLLKLQCSLKCMKIYNLRGLVALLLFRFLLQS